MIVALTVWSLGLNAVLAVVVLWLRRIQRGRRLPRRRPDFGLVERVLRERCRDRGAAAVLELERFEAGQWLCRGRLRYIGGFNGTVYQMAEQVVRYVARRCRVPGRMAGWIVESNDSDPAEVVGNTIEFGYSIEFGYPLVNEFIGKA